jgi:glycosyltransferase involved in cell wall biosynthesis
VATYNSRVCDELARRVDLDVLIPAGNERPHSDRSAAYRRFPAEALGRSLNPAGYDAVIYTLGNSKHHIATYDLARRFPGVLWLHDVRLGSFHHEYANARFPEDPEAWMRATLRKAYGPRLPTLDAVASPFDRPWQHRHGVFLTQELVRHARAVIVHSAFAEQMLRLDQGPDGPLPPVFRIPHALPPPPDFASLVRDKNPPLVVSVGSVGDIKAPDRLVDAVAALPSGIAPHLVFVGATWPPDVADLRQRAARLGLGDRIDFTGIVDDGEWWRWLRRATVAVQLRRLTNGETSGAIADAQSVGTPVVTNIIDAAVEYPRDAIRAIDNRLIPGELEDELAALLTDRVTWERHSRAGLDHARSCTFAHVVDLFLGRLESLLSREGSAAAAGWSESA